MDMYKWKDGLRGFVWPKWSHLESGFLATLLSHMHRLCGRTHHGDELDVVSCEALTWFNHNCIQTNGDRFQVNLLSRDTPTFVLPT